MLGDGTDVPKNQMFLWFCAAIVAAFLPHIDRFKLSDVEVQFREVKDEMREVRASVNELAVAQRKGRDQVYSSFASVLGQLSAEVRLEVQLELNRFHLKRIGVTPERLVEMLRLAGCYQGENVSEISPELISAIESVQRSLGVDAVDGVFGSVTLEAWNAEYGSSSSN
jgi:hypothetical protein